MNATVEVSFEHYEQGRPIYLVRVGNGKWETFTDYRQFVLYLKSLEAAGEILPPGYKNVSDKTAMRSIDPQTFDLDRDADSGLNPSSV